MKHFFFKSGRNYKVSKVKGKNTWVRTGWELMSKQKWFRYLPLTSQRIHRELWANRAKATYYICPSVLRACVDCNTESSTDYTGLYEMAERQALHFLQYSSQHCKEYQQKGINFTHLFTNIRVFKTILLYSTNISRMLGESRKQKLALIWYMYFKK